MRRVGNRSMPTCGRGMATGWTPGIGAMLILIGSYVETSITTGVDNGPRLCEGV
jgi:hypothetical protein